MDEISLKLKQRCVNTKLTLLDALKFMGATSFRSLLVLDSDNNFNGILSIGDVQRAIIKNLPMGTEILNVLRAKPRIASLDTPAEIIKEEMLKFRMEFMPVVHNKKVVKIFFWEDMFLNKEMPPKSQLNIPVIIMAGGIGSRLKPLTNVLPKPLIPIGEQTIIEEIFQRFNYYGCNNFFISVNYKADLIEFYLKKQNLPYRLEFFRERKPLGTAGSLSLLKGIINETVFVSNCDILIDQDYSEIVDYHRSNHNEITIVAALKHFPIEYGIIKTAKSGRLVELTEKPEFTFKINSGMYILEPHLLNEIPENKVFHLTSLINIIMKRNGRIGVFPVSESSWRDIGNWKEYQSAIKY